MNELVDSSQMHKTTHTPSCFKTDDDKRKGKCRLRFPHDLVDETSIDPATGLIRIKRNNARVANYNDYILLGMQCNMNITLTPVPGVLHYCIRNQDRFEKQGDVHPSARAPRKIQGRCRGTQTRTKEWPRGNSSINCKCKWPVSTNARLQRLSPT